MPNLRRLLEIPTIAHLLNDALFLAFANKPADSFIDILIRMYLDRYICLFLIKSLDCHDYPTPDEPDQLVPVSVVVIRPLIDVRPATTSTFPEPVRYNSVTLSSKVSV